MNDAGQQIEYPLITEDNARSIIAALNAVARMHCLQAADGKRTAIYSDNCGAMEMVRAALKLLT